MEFYSAYRILFAEIILLFSVSVAYAKQPLSDFKLSHLKTAEVISLDKVLKNKNLIVLFTVDCASCKMQLKSLSCLEETYNILPIGGYARRQALHRDYIRTKVKYSAYRMSERSLQNLKWDTVVFPKLLLIGIEGKVYFEELGAQKSCDQLKSKLDKAGL